MRVVGALLDHLAHLLIGKLQVRVLPLDVSFGPVVQFLLVVAFQVFAAKTV